MWKHLTAFIVIIITVSLGYGLWLYSESLRTNEDFGSLLKSDLTIKRQKLSDFISK